ncbi:MULTISPECIES: hypothetical protein [unclassified Variovorax]|uniref:hypothetical protein n=1 Tax=unclassified Variovorax TaxID=663243 RepID=UPI00076C2A69|nr:MULTISPECIES: hypothetical protein [unclassified Variovorax]KWT98442.1 hypothetical protein APY03_0577 [Variovorax sp. WDL1]PNG49889.1 hypothetical protein CHC06_05470 [Variovorax sp. B2]PNG50761.1 hypothetical protein CHC07_05375 [Variovorax sp. B4]VTU42154.1 hypothetical protein H6P1_00119 [Variovorax sp. PBL-H6]VTU44212.1 hypothetical protein SRS16P1_00783 [Variovorax sp. SRS16]
MTTTTTPRPFSRSQALAVLEMQGAQSAHLVDAVLLGLAELNEQSARDGSAQAQLRVLFSQVDPTRVQFALFAGEQRVQLCAYEYDPEMMGGPELACTDVDGQLSGPCALTRRLHPLMDMALARMESQVWARVTGG